ncbi:hypothetical protein L7D48_26150 [Streptomyces sp. S1A]|uniref:hypothetical protein n=1 Tax=Streptomyces sp. ICN903 TaxID=2964654 RepID=UPI001EDC2B30|nr:hypothetical protein [Streptomyces sp. ICN903]MCG3044018.1 hypothetical protein [Streptomyces sp. ICN903]
MTTTTPPNHPCTWGSYSYLVLIHEGAKGDKVWQRKATGCADTTQRTFAAGHDAKLKSLLIAAGVGGHQAGGGPGPELERRPDVWALG